MTIAPRVSIGMPVFNGERYLEEAVRSILAQTFRDFELLICDNASTDGTEAIARRLAAGDDRIRYIRNEENIGAAPNFNRVVEFAKGEYFKWAAHDDLCEPACLERLVEVLDSDPDTVIAFSNTTIIDADSEPIEPYDFDLGADVPSADDRLRAVLVRHKCFEIFGLIRLAVLRQTPLIGAYSHGDGVLLAELALHGKFTEVPEALFLARRHPEQSMAMIGDYRRYAVWFNPALRNKMLFPHWRIFFEYLRSVLRFRVRLSVAQRWRCALVVARAAVARRNSLWRDVGYQLRRVFTRRASGSRIPFESVVEMLEALFSEKPDRPSEIRRVSGEAGAADVIELTFSSTKIGTLYMADVSKLSNMTEWSIRIVEECGAEQLISEASGSDLGEDASHDLDVEQAPHVR